jgi:N-acetylmuramic acid 6-phosphate etherase
LDGPVDTALRMVADMTRREFVDPRLTEQRNPRTVAIDVASSLEIVDLLNAEDRTVAAVVYESREALARTIDLVADAFEHHGRLIYVGAGTSGRLGVLDAAECPPTFGSDPRMVCGIIAGGRDALSRSQEGAEDDGDAGIAAVDSLDVGPRDVTVGIAASGTTPFVNSAVIRAKERGAKTVFLTCTAPPDRMAAVCDELIVVAVGPEALTGSTRLKAGTATKMVLNTISTGAMIRVGKAYGNLMVDLMTLSDKLIDRGERIVMETCGIDRPGARRALAGAAWSVKVAIVMVRCAVNAAEARRMLSAAGGRIRAVAGDPPPVSG